MSVPGEEVEQQNGERAESCDPAAQGDTSASTTRRISPDAGVVIERHGLTVPPAPLSDEEP